MSIYNPYYAFEEEWEEFRHALATNFEQRIQGARKLFTVNTDRLWDAFLNNIPEDQRQVYDCRTCRHFVERFGGIVLLNESGDYESALWNMTPIGLFSSSLTAMQQYICNQKKVNGVFVSDVAVLGVPETQGWTHMSITLPAHMVNNSRLKNASQIRAEYAEDFRTLINALQTYNQNAVEQAIALLNTNAMYRSDRVLGIAKWFNKLQKKLAEAHTSVQKHNMIWYAIATAPTGYCHVRSSVIGSLLDDIIAGYSTRVIKARFEEKMNPANYMRSQSVPTANAIAQAEEIVEKLGVADSLRRRYARFDEVKERCIWLPRERQKADRETGGVFSHLRTKAKDITTPVSLDLPTTTMTWEKFKRTVLPEADQIEALVDNTSRFIALVTASVEGSELIFNWDNPFSWYYHGGIDGEMKRRVEAAGGKYENCVIRCSLMWDSYTDLDLHCVTPAEDHIFFQHKRGRCGGWLDVDANGGRATTKQPVENIRWQHNACNGHYRFMVHNYQDRNQRYNPYTIELQVGDHTYRYAGIMHQTGEQHEAFSFDYHNGVVSNMKIYQEATVEGVEDWGVVTQQFVPVKGIIPSPNIWDEETTNGSHTFFILEGCHDTNEEQGRGFFNEILKPELYEIRKTLEVYTAETPIEGADEADACGIGYAVDRDWNLTLKVTTDNSKRLIKIDRYD